MSGLEASLIKVGSSAAKFAVQSWIGSRRAERERERPLIDQITNSGINLFAGRRLERQFEQLADKIAEDLRPLIDTEFRGLTSNERTAALLAVTHAFDHAQLTDAALFASDLDPRRVEILIRSSLDLDLLDEQAIFLANTILRECVAKVVQILTALPAFQPRAISELLKREATIIDLLEQVLDRMPTISPGTPSDSIEQEFSLRYRREVVRRLDEMELFGVPSYAAGRRYPLSIAYVSLSVDSSGASHIADESSPDDSLLARRVGKSASVFPTISVEEALSAVTGVVIKGEAGSGKTTLLRWLAVRSAQRSLPTDLEDWNELIPIFIPLRRYAKAGLPAPESFLDDIASHILGYKPDGWVTRLLESGRGLILIDGVDELPDSQRGQMRTWLESLTETYGKCRWVVTTRPPAARGTWLPRKHFATMTLQPMGVVQTRSFIQHWHSAMKAGTSEEEQNSLDASQSSLMLAVEATPALRSLASNPLLCALMCALHVAREGQLPRDRMELYRVALEMLLSRRDEERGVLDATGRNLSHRDKVHILERLAGWFIINELVDSSQSDALRVVEQILGNMPGIRDEPDEVFTYLLLRSGILRAPAEGRIDFVHKTFQEFMGAKSLVEQLHFSFLVSSADKEEFHEVIVMAVGHARRNERENLIGKLLRRLKDSHNTHQVLERLRFVVVSCMETCQEIDPAIYARMNDILKVLVPLKTISQASRIARMGEPVLPLLQSTPPQTAHEVVATIRALSLIGGPEALQLVAQLVSDSSIVVDELIRAWSYFPPDDFAQNVLSRCDLRGRPVKIADIAVVGALPLLQNLDAVELDCAGEEVQSLWRLEDVPRLRSLRISGGDGLKSLDGVQRHELLKQVSLINCGGLSDVTALEQLPQLEELVIRNTGYPVAIRTRAMPSLVKLTISSPSPASTRGIVSGKRLRSLHVINCSVSNLKEFGASEGLEELRIERFRDLVSLEGISQLGRLRGITISRCPQLSDLLPVAQHPHLGSVHIWSSMLVNFETLRDSRCNELDIRYCDVSSLEWISDLVHVRRLRLIGCMIGSLHSVGSLSLESLDVRNSVQGNTDFIDFRSVYLDTRCEVIISTNQVVRNLPSDIRVYMR